MNPIKYVKKLRIWLGFATIFSFIVGFFIVSSLDPYLNNLYIFAFLATMLIFLTCLVSLLGLWWFFDERRKLLRISQINQIIYQSLITSTIAVCTLVLNQTNLLNIVSAMILIGSYLLYQLWSNSN
jgi:hypothetical protein